MMVKINDSFIKHIEMIKTASYSDHLTKVFGKYGFEKVAADMELSDNQPQSSAAKGLGRTLQVQQQRVVDKLKKTDKLLVYHGMGSGKTLTALAVAENQGKQLKVVGPAGLKHNFDKEKLKHHVNTQVTTSTYNKPVDFVDAKKDILVFDEAHRMGNIASQRSHLVDRIKGSKTMFLTGTPIRNHPEELIPLMRGLGIETARDNKSFRSNYIKEKVVNPNIIARIFAGAKPGIELQAKNLNKLEHSLKGKVDYYKGTADGYPTVREQTINVDMSKGQQGLYDKALKSDPGLRYKVRKGMAPSHEEATRLNAFMTLSRQISNDPGDLLENSTIDDAPKVKRVLQEIQSRYTKDKNYKGVTYSTYLKHGLNPVEKGLKASGIPYGVYTGKTTDTAKSQMIKDYNEGKIKQLLISGAGGEGLDLKGTKLIQLMEPHWNDPQLEQVKGRAIRYKSHDALPEAERQVEVQKYVARTRPKGFIFKSRQGSTDEYLMTMAKKKQDLNDKFLHTLQKAGS